jgi:cystathionine beta-lyase
MARSLPSLTLTLEALRERRSEKWSAYPPDILPAWLAEMDFAPAPAVRDVLISAIAVGDLGYANGNGLGDAFASFALDRWDWEADPLGTFVVPDALVAITEVLRLFTSPNDAVIVNPPVYGDFYRVIAEASCRPVDVPLRRVFGRWMIDFEGLEAAFRGGAGVYLLCSPHNPVGRAFGVSELTMLAQLAARYGVLVISDEIFGPLALPGAAFAPFCPIAMKAGADALAIVSATKAWSFSGLKCALLVDGTHILSRRQKAPRNELRYQASHLGVLASIAAYRSGGVWLDETIAYIDGNRKWLREQLAGQLPSIGYEPPEAGYLGWLDCTRLGVEDPAATFLEHGRVALTPGISCGSAGDGFVRLNMGTSREILTEVVQRMATAVSLTRTVTVR